MTKYIRLGNAGTLGILATLLFAASAPAGEIQWRHDYNTARKEALAKNLPLLVDFGTQHCPWCVKMESATYRDSGVVGYVNQHFVCVKVDGDKDTFLTRGMAVECFPTAVMASPDGKVLDRVEGFMAASAFSDHLRKAVTASVDWPKRAWTEANAALAVPDYPRAIGCLKRLSTAPAAGTYQGKATEVLAQLEGQANEEVRQAVQLHAQGREGEARQGLGVVAHAYIGTQAATNAQGMLNTWVAQETPMQASFKVPAK
jgi:thioredoxin-like negative regulator of GroEL